MYALQSMASIPPSQQFSVYDHSNSPFVCKCYTVHVVYLAVIIISWFSELQVNHKILSQAI